jgi:hypothetical protein
MERIRAEMGNPRFTGKGAVIEGVLTLKSLVDCSDVSELAMIEDLSALAEKTVIVTLEPIQQEIKFDRPKPRKQAEDARQAEIIPKVWEVRVNTRAIEEAPAQLGRFWSFIAQEALAEIPAAVLISPFLPGSDGEQLMSMRVTTPERDMIAGYLATRAKEAAGEVPPLTLTLVVEGEGELAADVPEPWLAVGKQVLVPMELGPEWANAADYGGMVLATVVEIRNGEDGQPQDVELQFTNEADGEVATLIVHASEVLPPIAAEPAEEWPFVGSIVRIAADVAADTMEGCAIVDGYASGTVVSLDEEAGALVRVVMAEGPPLELGFITEDLERPELPVWPFVGALAKIPKDAAFDADVAAWVIDGFAGGEILSIENGTATVRMRVLSGETKDLAFLVEVLVNPAEGNGADHLPEAGQMVDDAEPATGDATYPESPVPDHEARAATLGRKKKATQPELQAA